MNSNGNSHSFREYPFYVIFFGLSAIFLGYYFYTRGAGWVVSGIILVVGLGILLSASILDVDADTIKRTLSISRRGLFSRYYREIPFSEISAIQVGSSYDSDDGSRSYRVEITLKDGSVVPLRNAYSGGRVANEKKAVKLREFIGVGGRDSSLGGLLDVASAVALQINNPKFRAEQESITGNQDEIHERSGIRWRLETLSFGSAPVSRWHSADYTLPNNFLYLAQKLEGQINLPDNKLTQALYDKLFMQSLKIFGFDKSDIPNSENADVFPLDARLDAHFIAYTSDKELIPQVLSPWVAIPLANWVEKHSSSQNSSEKLAVLFSPKGVYLAVPGYVNTEYLDELTDLGVEIVLAQN